MNVPNIITLCRLALIPVFLALWWTHFYLSATIVFLIASVTDLVDGYLARVSNQETRLGALLDPLVDKVLVTTGFVMLVEMNIVPGWAVVIMLCREFLVTGLRTILIDKGILLSAGKLGKLKTFLQMLAIGSLYFGLSLKEHNSVFYDSSMYMGLTIFWLAFAVTLISGVQYALKGKNLLNEKETADSRNSKATVLRLIPGSAQEKSTIG